MEFLAGRVGDQATKKLLNDMLASDVAFLRLDDPAQAELVDLIADALPAHVASLDDAQLRNTLQHRFTDLYDFAREQQRYNCNPTTDTSITIGPLPAAHFHLGTLKSSVESYLKKVDHIRIDVSDYSPEQRAAVSDYVAQIGNPRVEIVGNV